MTKPLGGIGANIGTKEWENKNGLRSKMIKFAKEVELTNKFRLLNNKTTKPLELKPNKKFFGVNGPVHNIQ